MEVSTLMGVSTFKGGVIEVDTEDDLLRVEFPAL